MEIALSDDIARVLSEVSDCGMEIRLMTESGEQMIEVQPDEDVGTVLRQRLKLPHPKYQLEALSGGESVLGGNFADAGLEHGATISVLYAESAVFEVLRRVVHDTMALNPQASRDALIEGMSFNVDGSLQSWNLEPKDPTRVLCQLPNSFGELSLSGDLILSGNNLTDLSVDFGSLQLGGELHLPASIREIPRNCWPCRQLAAHQKIGTFVHADNVDVGDYAVLKGHACRLTCADRTGAARWAIGRPSCMDNASLLDYGWKKS